MTNFSTDRAAGVLLGCAAGDALGAGYEFQNGYVTGKYVCGVDFSRGV